MKRFLLGLMVLSFFSACEAQNVAEFWRPISDPNIMMSVEQQQTKLDYDISQCSCGIFPKTTPTDLAGTYEPNQQRMIETSVTVDEEKGQCTRQPSMVVSECMRARGWEVTKCSGRMPTAGGGAVCSAYVF